MNDLYRMELMSMASELDAQLDPLSRGRDVVDIDAHVAAAPAHLDDNLFHRADDLGVIDLAGNAEGLRQVVRAHENDVAAGYG